MKKVGITIDLSEAAHLNTISQKIISKLISKIEEFRDNLVNVKKDNQIKIDENRFLETQNTDLKKQIEIL